MVLVQLLGPVEYRATGGNAVELGQAKQRCVFAMLAVSANEVVMPDELINWAWGADPPKSARNMIHSYISRLRGALEGADDGKGAILRRRHGGYVLEAEPDAIDLHRFRRTVAAARAAGTDTRTATGLLREALNSWRGRPLGGVPGEWATRTRWLLEREHLSALVECHEGELRLGGGTGLLDELHSLADQHPDNELVIRNLMTGLHRSGRRTEAVEAYETLRRRLADQLGVDPAQQTKALRATILRADPDLAAAGPRTDVAPSVPRQLPRGIRCVGREQELAMLDGSVTAADGRPVTRVIEGPPGIGKTALAVQWAHRVAHRFPDGQIFVDLHGSSVGARTGCAHVGGRAPEHHHGPAEPARRGRAVAPTRDRAPSGDDVLRFVLRSLGVVVPPGETDPVAFGRSALENLRVLVVLDDLASPEQLEVLQHGPPAGALLVTTRDAGRLSGIGALRTVGLRELSVQQAQRMLAGILGERRVEAEPWAVTRIIDLCGRSPRALSAAAEQALVRPWLPLEDLAAAMAGRSGVI
ncbi:BTAD domain-containing putative transcriptional regulator [Streptomyces sp. B1I3]|uniref:BTAD domain-containing putative transcriptional regulator n=1 Tax=Streptomyces sp. B1I3 TaxID=3042264 RepID=UPI0027881C15|nr:BTAD domain-containing putative transcriptional regulator [Streptomyces sp. B1I3]MDQ0795269.1 DNA-binding SARP family transcriptional activator [Streptomyces sp. B1I3]